ncbi:preprotein translocase SecA chain [Bradyrhizobium sp. SSBR45G]|uniref:hypothetical protein n=1 Tax=unclassified Bradyrhizobium TaxID=2631580 RepID=UPI0023429A20|nr:MULTISPECIES: hypothetical protein [unclassified Bradyrhizobium]GLH76593.1 preprotein translocase SecA chain [Bradyrhizobium sp. SSBR45G]
MARTDDIPPAEGTVQAIHRSRGSTASERLLADLGEHAFLDLWSYPNLFYEKKQGGVGDGKELCDMLVVCGDDVIIFSDKHIKYQDDKPIQVAWPRFYRKAIEGAVKQINGANNWITRFPERIFTDSACTQKLPIDLPPVETRRTHGVVVATGAHRAIQDALNDDSGSFMIMPSLKGQEAIDFSQPGYMPFCVGDVNPGGMFIHVFDNVGIKRVLEHLNTITDFTRYLNKRAEYIRSGKLFMCHGEEELLANYLNVGIRTGGEYDFELPRKKGNEDAGMVTLQGEWSRYVLSEGYFAKTLADDISYTWDRLITVFTENLLAGTTETILGETATIATAERGLRFMAAEGRFARRMLGEAVDGALRKAMEFKQDRYARVMFPSQINADDKVAYVIVVVAYPVELEARGGLKRGYVQYRETRAKILEAYCLGVLHDNRNLNTVVAIGMDAHSSQTGRKGGSEDMLAMRIDEWTDSLIESALKAKEHYDVLRENRIIKQKFSRDEYPALGEPTERRWPKNRPSSKRFKKRK